MVGLSVGIVSSGEWKDYREERLSDLLRTLFFVYGASNDTTRIQATGTIYRHALGSGMDADTRILLENEMGQLIDAEPFTWPASCAIIDALGSTAVTW
jgi:hypothetical protein